MERRKAGRPRSSKRPKVTGLRLDRDLVLALKHKAIDEQATLTELLNQAMQTYLMAKYLRDVG